MKKPLYTEHRYFLKSFLTSTNTSNNPASKKYHHFKKLSSFRNATSEYKIIFDTKITAHTMLAVLPLENISLMVYFCEMTTDVPRYILQNYQLSFPFFSNSSSHQSLYHLHSTIKCHNTLAEVLHRVPSLRIRIRTHIISAYVERPT